MTELEEPTFYSHVPKNWADYSDEKLWSEGFYLLWPPPDSHPSDRERASLPSRVGFPGYFHFWFFTHHLDMKQKTISYPRRSDCPGSFHSRQSSGTTFKRLPFYGKDFTQTPSPQPRLFLACNPISLIVKVLASFRFLFIRCSVTSNPFIRSVLLYNDWNLCYTNIWALFC